MKIQNIYISISHYIEESDEDNDIDIEDGNWIGFCTYRRFWSNTTEGNYYGKLKDSILQQTPKEWNNYESVLVKALPVNNTKLSKILKHGKQYILKNPSILFNKKNITYCYCISEYPLSFEKINWKDAIKYDGFSDHTMDILAPVLYSMLKKQKLSKRIYIEKHVKSSDSKGPDASTSITTEKLSEMVKQIRKIEKMKI